MATRAMTEMQGLNFTGPSPTEGWIHTVAPSRLRRSRGFMHEGDTVYVSTQIGLNGAKAAFTALALQAGMAAGVYGVWLLWHLTR